MLSLNPADRPTALGIERDFELIGGFRGNSCSSPFRGACCNPFITSESWPEAQRPGPADTISRPFETALTISIGNTYNFSGWHHWKFFVHLSLENMIEEVHVFLVRTSFRRESRRTHMLAHMNQQPIRKTRIKCLAIYLLVDPFSFTSKCSIPSFPCSFKLKIL